MSDEDAAPLLSVEGIDTFYGSVQILDGVTLHVDPGEFVAIIGPNGAGKSTALKAVFCLVPKRRGVVRFAAEDITKLPPQKIVRRGLSFVPQGRAVFPSLSVSENLDMGGFLLKDARNVKAAKERVYAIFPLLRDRRDQVAASLSGGEQQVLAMGRALMVEPRMLLLDEPSVELAPQMVEEVMGKVREIHRAGTAVLMVEQNAAMALSVSDRAYVLVNGRNRLEGRGRDLLADPTVQQVYLGLDPPAAAGAGVDNR